MDAKIELLTSKRDVLHRKFDQTDSRAMLDKFMEQGLLVEERAEMARCAFMHNKNFWKEMWKLGLLPTTDNVVPSTASHQMS